jgi:DNA-binding winged helix-turn-helix (wHTH) protein
MGATRGEPAENRRQGRRWRFADATLDEDSWSLVVNGTRVPLEPKPMELLHELLLRAGEVVTKDELLDAIWPGVLVVEASLPTAVLKLRRALGDHRRENAIIETVSGIGYRLVGQVEVESNSKHDEIVQSGDTLPPPANEPANNRVPHRLPRLAAAVVLVAGIFVAVHSLQVRLQPARQTFSQQDTMTAIRRLDVERIETMLRAGWNPNAPLDDQGNGALNWVANICEWDPAHDRRRMLLMARTLIDGGAEVDKRNTWGDTPYSIAKAKRYCGPDHPITIMMRAQCNSSLTKSPDRCLATYELARAAKRQMGRASAGASTMR